MRAVVSLGGSVVARAVENGNLDEYVDAFTALADRLDTLVVVTGAGDLKRYIDAVDGFGISEARKDLVGIAATRMHANTLAAALDANVRVPHDLETVDELARTHDIIVLGGLIPGQSTDAVGAECAELLDADRFIVATTVDGVYDADPVDNDDAAKYDTMQYGDVVDMIRSQDSSAGTFELLDLTAAKLIERSQIETVVLDGRDPAVLERGLDDDHDGTIIDR